MKSSPARILVVEDEAGLAFGLKMYFQTSGYTVEVAGDGRSALEHAAANTLHLVILDLMLPDVDGLDVLSSLKKDHPTLPVIILSARTAEPYRITGLRRGADDYVTKPFSLAELELRVQRQIMIRASTMPQVPEITSFGDVIINHATRAVSRAGKGVRLTSKEFELLQILVTNAGRPLTREHLLRHIWNYPPSVETRTLDQHIARLRNKVESDPRMPRHIVTIPRIGFVFVK